MTVAPTSPHARRRAHRVAPAVVLAGLMAGLMAGCAAAGTPASPGSAPAPGSPPAQGAAPTGSADGRTVEGTSYRFTLPADPLFTELPQRTTARGAIERQWHYAVQPGGPFCTVAAAEEPQFTQLFPGAVIALFAATNAEAGEHVVRNDSASPVDGAVGGVEQEATFPLRLASGATVDGRLFERQYLTPGRTLVSLSAAGPQDRVGACGLEALVRSLQVTGRELPLASTPSTGA
jgi:hypothetical protein